MLKIRKGDNVKVMRGKDAGKTGEVLAVVKVEKKNGLKQTKVVVRGVNKVTKHQKPNPMLSLPGGIVQVEKPLDISNVMIVDSKGKASRVKMGMKEGKKVRLAVRSHNQI